MLKWIHTADMVTFVTFREMLKDTPKRTLYDNSTC
jgi:hypothetical protein